MSFAICDKCGLDDCECVEDEIGIVELLAEIGNERITYQSLHHSITGAKQKAGACEVSFVTDCMTPGDLLEEPEKIGIVVWVDRDVFSNAHKNLND